MNLRSVCIALLAALAVPSVAGVRIEMIAELHIADGEDAVRVGSPSVW